MIKGEYEISLLQGRYGIWLFVLQDGRVLFERAGIKSLDEALAHAKAVIELADKNAKDPFELDSGN
jgi:hypothetical protein